MLASISPDRRLLRVEEAIALANGGDKEVVGRGSAYREVQEHGTLLGVPVLRLGRKILIPRKAFETVLDGVDPTSEEVSDAA